MIVAEPSPVAAEARGVFTPELLDRCISCGFCLPACPTYALTGVETSSPRGRINLMRALETGVLGDDDPTALEEASFCLGCRACESVCPAGVQYGELVEEWRDHLWNGRRRPVRLWPLLWAVDSPQRVRAMGVVRRHAGRRSEASETANLMLGCFERVLYPRVSRAARELAPELAAPVAQGCCGALHAHNGELERGRELARALGAALPGTIVSTSGGCAAHLAGVLGSDRVMEFSQWMLARESAPVATPEELLPEAAHTVSRNGVTPPTPAGRLRIGLQDSCHLRHGLGVWSEPRELIARVGEYVELPSAAACCGAAGSYSVVRPRDSARVLEPHLDEIAAADLDVLAVVNAGCYRQLQQGVKRRHLRTRVVHLAELLAGEGHAHPPKSPADIIEVIPALSRNGDAGHPQEDPGIALNLTHARADTVRRAGRQVIVPTEASRAVVAEEKRDV
jgi:glycolate oxidase iron-sulfur subunit